MSLQQRITDYAEDMGLEIVLEEKKSNSLIGIWLNCDTDNWEPVYSEETTFEEISAHKVLLIDGHNDALVGVRFNEQTKCWDAIYSEERIIARLISDGMDPDEASEFYFFNIEGSKFSNSNPMYISTLECVFELSKTDA